MQHEEPSRNKSKKHISPQPNDTNPNLEFDSNETPYTTDENDAIALLLAIASGIYSSTSTKKLKTASPLAQGKKHITNGQPTTASYTTNVHCEYIELIKFIHTELGWRNKKKYIEKTVTTYNDHHSIQYRARAFPKPVSDREWHISIITKKLDDETIVVVTVPCFVKELEKIVHPDRVRAELWTMYKLTKISNTMTRVEFYAKLDFGGYIPRWIINRELPKIMSAPTRWQEHFQHQQKLNQLTAEDGKNMGIMLMIKVKGESVEKRLEDFLGKNQALQFVRAQAFPQFQIMMLHVLRNKIVDVGEGESTERVRKTISKMKMKTRFTVFHKNKNKNKVEVEPAHPHDARAVEISASYATRIGKKLALLLLTTTEPSAAVDSWLKDNNELDEFVTENIWFEPMMCTIAKALLKGSSLGLKYRVALGAGLSVMDMITDTGVINSYRASGNMTGAYSLMAMIGTSMAVQLAIAYVQNIKKSKWVILREMLFVVTFLKPGVDAYRVATGHIDEDAVVSPLLELALAKGTELAFESVPGGLLQAYIFINAPEKKMFFLISILISTLTTGFSSAMVSYDMDVSVANRKEVPLFYGYIKDGYTERMITFLLQVRSGS